MRRLAVLALLLSTLVAQPALAAGSGQVDGKLIDKTPGATLQAGGTATLYQVSNSQDPKEIATVTVPASGAFSFNNVETDPSSSYRVLAQYGGAPYVSETLTFPSGSAHSQTQIEVYEGTEDDSLLSVDAMNIVITNPDAGAHEIPMLQANSFVNNSQRTFIPNTTPRNGGPPNLLRFSLPPNASSLEPAAGIAPEDIIQIGEGFGALTPLTPGPHDLDFSFRAPYQSSSLTFVETILYPTKTLRVLAPSGKLRISSPQLQADASRKIGSQSYDVLVGSNLKPGARVTIELSALPGISPLAFLSQPRTLGWIAGILGLAVLALLAWYVRDRLGPKARVATVSAGGAAGRRDLELQQRELLISLARLDDRFEAGAISAEDYRLQRDSQKAELRELMKTLEGLPG